MFSSRGYAQLVLVLALIPSKAVGFGLRLPPYPLLLGSGLVSHSPSHTHSHLAGMRQTHRCEIFTRRQRTSRPARSCPASCSSSPTGADACVERLEAWLAEAGAEFSALRVCEFEGGMRGVAAARDLNAGEVVLRVDLSIILVSDDICTRTPPWQPLAKCMVDHGADSWPPGWEGVQWQGRMAYRLAIERDRGQSSPWGAYIATLPRHPPSVPARWNETELSLLQDPWLRAEAESLSLWSSELYADTAALEPPHDYQGCKMPTLDEFMWALDTLQSRTIRLDPEDLPAERSPGGLLGAEEGGSVRALVPMLDLLNHCQGCDTHFLLSDCGEAVELRIGYAVKKGRQVYLNYGDMPNGHFVQFYGFALGANPEEVVRLREKPTVSMEEWEASPEVTERGDKEAILLRHLGEIPLLGGAWLGWAGLSDALVDAYRLLCSDQDDFEEVLHGDWRKALGRGEEGLISERNERQAAQRLAHRVRQEFARFEAPVPGGGVASVYVEARQRILQRAAQALEARARGEGDMGGMAAAIRNMGVPQD